MSLAVQHAVAEQILSASRRGVSVFDPVVVEGRKMLEAAGGDMEVEQEEDLQEVDMELDPSEGEEEGEGRSVPEGGEPNAVQPGNASQGQGSGEGTPAEVAPARAGVDSAYRDETLAGRGNSGMASSGVVDDERREPVSTGSVIVDVPSVGEGVPGEAAAEGGIAEVVVDSLEARSEGPGVGTVGEREIGSFAFNPLAPAFTPSMGAAIPPLLLQGGGPGPTPVQCEIGQEEDEHEAAMRRARGRVTSRTEDIARL